MPRRAKMRIKMILVGVSVWIGCGVEKQDVEPERMTTDSVDLEPGRVGSIRVGSSLDSVMRRATLIADELRMSIGGGDMDRYMRIAIGDDTLELVPRDSRVGRVHVLSPRWRTAEGLGVGTSARELSRYPLREATFWAEGLFVSLRTHCGTYFVIGEGYDNVIREDEDVTSERLEQLGDSVRVSMVVVGGAC